MTLEQGKPLAQALGEVMYGASIVEWYAEEAKLIYSETIPASSGDKRIVTSKQPSRCEIPLLWWQLIL